MNDSDMLGGNLHQSRLLKHNART